MGVASSDNLPQNNIRLKRDGHLYDPDSTTTTQKQGEKVDSRAPSARHLHRCTQSQAQRSPLSQQEYVQSQTPIILTHGERDHPTSYSQILHPKSNGLGKPIRPRA
ncbi:hypothetical protein RSAG8_13793, partial [Rhizoctonia solani AG-8 WAC10335]